jgi:hypothetical protein
MKIAQEDFEPSAPINRLIIHPADRSTVFLKDIYEPLENKIVINRGVKAHRELNQSIQNAEQVIMLGHGTENGLLAVQMFGMTSYVVDKSLVSALAEKDNNVFIWCFAKDFVKKNNLKGFCTGMFISEMDEAIHYGVDCTENDIIISNKAFASILSNALAQNFSSVQMFEYVSACYGELATNNEVANYNHERLDFY